MEINGIKIKEMKDAQDILAAMEVIKVQIENANNTLEKNYTLNSKLNDEKNNISDVIESLTKIQIESKNTFDTQKNFTENEFKPLEKKIENAVEEAVKDVNLHDMKQMIKKTILDSIKMTKNSQELLDVVSKLTTTTVDSMVDKVTHSVKKADESVRKINIVIENLKLWWFLASGFGGLVVGGLIVGLILK